MTPRLLLVLVFCLPTLGLATPASSQPLPVTDVQSSAPVSESTKKSLLRVNSTNQDYDFRQPWLKKTPFGRRGIGVLIDGGRILVTAELVANSNFIELEKPTTAEKSSATVERVDYDSNLAALRPDDPKFLEGMTPIGLEESVRTGDSADILQLEPNGEIAQTLGRITSTSVGPYPFENVGLLLNKLSAPLQQRDGSFTLPAVRDGRLIGLLMRYDARNQTADVIPLPVIRHFLAELAAPTYKGFPRLGLSFSSLRDPQLRRYIGLTEPGGIYITEIAPHSSAEKAGLKKGDTLLSVDGHPIDQDGLFEDPRLGRILFSHITNTLSHPGAVLPFGIFRDGKRLEIPVTMEPPDRSRIISESHLSGASPKYVILGGLVFIELSRPYLKEWGSSWLTSAPQRLVYYDAFQNELPTDRGKIVLLSRVLPSADSLGYEDLENIVVSHLNGFPIKSLSDLADAAQHPIDGFQKIALEEDPKMIILDAASIEANRETLVNHYSLPALQNL